MANKNSKQTNRSNNNNKKTAICNNGNSHNDPNDRFQLAKFVESQWIFCMFIFAIISIYQARQTTKASTLSTKQRDDEKKKKKKKINITIHHFLGMNTQQPRFAQDEKRTRERERKQRGAFCCFFFEGKFHKIHFQFSESVNTMTQPNRA